MSIKIRESDVERYLISRLESIGLSAIKFIPDNRTGMPDRIVLLPNNTIRWVELKTDNGRLSQIQKYRHQELKNQGHTVSIIWSRAGVDELVEELRSELEV